MDNRDFEATRQAVKKCVDAIRERDIFHGVKTGYKDLDYGISGLRNGDLIVVGGRTAMGKTAFALNLLENIAIGEGKCCLYFSLSDPTQMIVERLIGQVAQIDLHKDLNDEEINKICEVSQKIADAPIIIDYCEGVSANRIVDSAKQYFKRHKVSLVVVDYLQLVTASETEVAKDKTEYAMMALKHFAREMDCPVVVLSQLSRSVEKRYGHRPLLNDLAGSGSIEEIADTVLLLYRDDYYNYDSAIKGIMEVIVAKNPFGQRRLIELIYAPYCYRISTIIRS